MKYKVKPSLNGVEKAQDVRSGSKLIATFYGDTAKNDAEFCARSLNLREATREMKWK